MQNTSFLMQNTSCWKLQVISWGGGGADVHPLHPPSRSIIASACSSQLALHPVSKWMWGFEFSLDFEPSKIYNLRCICHGHAHAQVLTENNSTKWSKKKIKVASNIPWLPIVLFSDGKFHGFLDTRNWKDHRSGALETKINSVFTNEEFPHIPGENKSET